MGSSGYITCGICHECGNCYPRLSLCINCGNEIDLDDDICKTCGTPITDEMRYAAREAFKHNKYVEFLKISSNTANIKPIAPGMPLVKA